MEETKKPTKRKARSVKKDSGKEPIIGAAIGVDMSDPKTAEAVTKLLSKDTGASKSLADLMQQYAKQAADRDAEEKIKTTVKPEPVISGIEDTKVSKKEAEALLEELAARIAAAREKAEDVTKFEVKGLIWEPKDGGKVRTIFIDDKVYVEFPMTEDGSVTAFYPYTTYNEDIGSSAVTFPADWLVKENAQQLAQMGCGATTITAVDDEDCSCDECCGCCIEDDDDSVSLSDLAELAIRELGITEDDIVAVIKNATNEVSK